MLQPRSSEKKEKHTKACTVSLIISESVQMSNEMIGWLCIRMGMNPAEAILAPSSSWCGARLWVPQPPSQRLVQQR